MFLNPLHVISSLNLPAFIDFIAALQSVLVVSLRKRKPNIICLRDNTAHLVTKQVKRARVKVLTGKRRENVANSFQKCLRHVGTSLKEDTSTVKSLQTFITGSNRPRCRLTCKTRVDDTSEVCWCSVGDMSAM